MLPGQAFVVGSCTLLWSVSCLLFVIFGNLTSLVWCLKPTLLAFPYTKCENIGAASGREIFCWTFFLRVFIIMPLGVWCFWGFFTGGTSNEVLGLHKKALEFFEAVLLQVLVHQLSHPSLYQHTLEIWYFLGLFLFLFFAVALFAIIFSFCSVLLT